MCMYYRSGSDKRCCIGTGIRFMFTQQVAALFMTATLKVWRQINSKIWLHQSMCIYLRNNSCQISLQSDFKWQSVKLFEDGCPNKKNSIDTWSVPDFKKHTGKHCGHVTFLCKSACKSFFAGFLSMCRGYNYYYFINWITLLILHIVVYIRALKNSLLCGHIWKKTPVSGLLCFSRSHCLTVWLAVGMILSFLSCICLSVSYEWCILRQEWTSK